MACAVPSAPLSATFGHGQTHLMQGVCFWGPRIIKIHKTPVQSRQKMTGVSVSQFTGPWCDSWINSLYSLGISALELCYSWLNFLNLFKFCWSSEIRFLMALCKTHITEMHIKCHHLYSALCFFCWNLPSGKEKAEKLDVVSTQFPKKYVSVCVCVCFSPQQNLHFKLYHKNYFIFH